MNVPRLEWDFSKCPENQLRDCHDYEFARHVERLVISARELRSMLGGMTFDQRLECLVSEENFPDMPGVPEWEEKGMMDFHYGPLWQFCAEFPSKPFLCVPPGQRETLAKEGANVGSIVLPFATLLTGWPDLSMSTEDVFRLPQDPHGPQGAIVGLMVRWELSNAELLSHFEDWLKKYRDQTVAVTERRGAGSEPRQLRKALKDLGTWRLLKQMPWNEAYLLTQEHLGKGLWCNRPEVWTRASKSAEMTLARLHG